MWLMPAGTPQDRVERFGAALKAVLANPELAETLKKRGMVPTFQTGSEAAGEVAELYKTLESVAAAMEK